MINFDIELRQLTFKPDLVFGLPKFDDRSIVFLQFKI